jgi:hypothetical protein
MKLRAVLLLSLILLAETVFARERTDVIVMQNGDRLTGEIRGLSSGILYINMQYILGTSAMDWSRVERVVSQQLFLVTTQDGSVYTGTLSTGGAPGARPVKVEIVEASGNTVAIAQPQIVEMDQTSTKFLQRFNGEINFGMIYTKGNQSTQYTLGSEVYYPRERWAAAASFNSTLSSSTGASTSTRNLVGATATHLLPWNQWFIGGMGNFLQSSEQEINLQTTLGAGVGRYLTNTNHATISLLGGFAWQSTQYHQSLVPLGQQNVATALINADAKLFRFNQTALEINATLLPAISQPGRVYFSMNATYYVRLFSNLRWDVSFYGNWDNRPPATFPGSDYGTSSGLSWTFGNR